MSLARFLPVSFLPIDASRSEETLPKIPLQNFQVNYSCSEEAVFSAPKGFMQHKIISKTLLTGQKAIKPVFSFVLEAAKHEYFPGDSFDVLCENSDARVSDILNSLQLDPSVVIIIEGEHPLSGRHLSFRTLFKKHLDINQFPKKVFLRHLAEYTQDEKEKSTLLFLSSRLGSIQYLALAKEYANLADFLKTFPNCKPSIECILLHLPPLSPRAFSVCSYQNDFIEFICSIDSYTTPEPDAQKRLGICSEYLQKLESDYLWISLRPPTSMRFPEEYNPMIMICAGAGLSPFIGFLRYAASKDIRLVDSWLFYGFRSLENDFLFREELEKYQTDGVLKELRVAVSKRPQNPKYVQDVLYENAEEIFQLMQNKKAKIYLCGDEMTMIKSVNECLERICLEKGGTKTILSEWTKEKRIIRDIWV